MSVEVILLLNLCHTIINYRRHLAEAVGVAVAHRVGDGDVGVVALEERLNPLGGAGQTRPEARVVDGAHYLHAAQHTRKHTTEHVERQVGRLGVRVYHVGAPAQNDVEHAQRKEQCGDALEEEVEAHVGHPRAVAAHASLFEFVDELRCVGGASAHYLYDMILHAVGLRLGDVGGYAFGAAKREVSYEVEYSHGDMMLRCCCGEMVRYDVEVLRYDVEVLRYDVEVLR